MKWDEYPEKFWHCRIQLNGARNNEDAFLNDATIQQIREQIVEPWIQNRAFNVGGVVIKNSSHIKEINIVQTSQSCSYYAELRENWRRGLEIEAGMLIGLSPIDERYTPFGEETAKDYTHELLFSLNAETELLAPDKEELEYNIEEQDWYAPSLPVTKEIGKEETERLQNEVDIVIVTATDEEIKAVMCRLKPFPRRKNVLLAFVGPETYYLGKFGEYKTVVTKCLMGSGGEGAATLATAQAQRLWNPKAIIMVGIAFGINPIKQRIADVLVASQIIPYEKQRIGEKIIPRDPIPPSNTTLLNRFENVHNWQFARPNGTYCSIRVGPILSGEKLVDDPGFKAKLFQQFPQAIGGEMEGAGLCAASGRVGTPWILVKSICDWGDGKKHKKHQPLAAAAATSLVHHVLSQKTVLDSL